MKSKSNIDFDNLDPSDHFSKKIVKGIRYNIGAKGRLPTLEEIDEAVFKHQSTEFFKKNTPKEGSEISLDINN
jgi:hypothetical protein